MNCPFCGADTFVIASAPTSDNRIRRRRECMGPSSHRFTSYEVYHRLLQLQIDQIAERLHAIGFTPAAIASIIGEIPQKESNHDEFVARGKGIRGVSSIHASGD